MGIGILFSSLLYSLLFIYTDKDPLVPIQFRYALGLCLLICVGVFIAYFLISSHGIWESVFTSSLWLFTALILTVYISKIDRFSIVQSLHFAKDYLRFVGILSIFQTALGVVFGYMVYPFAIKFKKDKSNYIEI